MRKSSPIFTPLILVVCSLSLSACSFMSSKNGDLGGGAEGQPLEVPPDLTRPQGDSQMVLPSHAQETFSDYSQGQRVSAPRDALLPESSDVSVQRDGDLRWLSVKAEAANLWQPVLGFLSKRGYTIEKEDIRIGLIETQWKESGMVIGDSFTKSMFANLLNPNREPGTRDRLRIRLERGVMPGTTEIFVTHDAQIEVLHDEDMVWENRKDTQDLEAETLSRLMVHLGQPESETAVKMAATQATASRATLNTADANDQYILLNEDFGRAWRLTGVALDRVGFTIEGRDHEAGNYQVRYTDKAPEDAKPGFFSRLLTPTREVKEETYRIKLTTMADQTKISIQDSEGKAVNPDTTGRILKQLYEQLQ